MLSKFTVAYLISVLFTTCLSNKSTTPIEYYVYVLKTSVVDDVIRATNTLPIAVRIFDDSIEFIRQENLVLTDIDRTDYYGSDIYLMEDKQLLIRLEDSLSLERKSIGEESLVLRSDKNNYNYVKISSKTTSEEYDNNFKNEDFTYSEGNEKRVYLSPAQYCSRKGIIQEWAVTEVDFSDGRNVFLSGDIRTLYLDGLLFIKHSILSITVINRENSGNFVSTTQNATGYLTESSVDFIDHYRYAKDQLPSVWRSGGTDLLTPDREGVKKILTSYKNVVFTVNGTNHIINEYDTIELELGVHDDHVDLKLNGEIFQTYSGLNLSPSGRNYYATDQDCNILLLKASQDGRELSTTLNFGFNYGDNYENRIGWSTEVSFAALE